jgi:hypothetical protein
VPYLCGPSLDARQLQAALRSAGFEIDEITAVLHCPRIITVLLARFFDRIGPPSFKDVFLRALRSFERLERLPSRYMTGYFVAARCTRNS